MKKTLRMLVLVLLLAGSVYAGEMPNGITGEMPNGVTSTSPPTTTNAVQEPVTETQDSQATESILTDILINMLQSLRVLF